MGEGYKATVEIGACRVTFEGPREFVEEQIALWRSGIPSKQLAASDGLEGEPATAARELTERDLVAAKRPSGHLEIVAVLAFSLTQAGMDEFSDEDVRRAYLRAGIRPPKVVAQALRDAKNRMDYIEPGSRRGFYRLSHHGDRTVRFDLPRQ